MFMKSENVLFLPEVSKTTANIRQTVKKTNKKNSNIFVFRHHTLEPLRGGPLTTLQSLQSVQ